MPAAMLSANNRRDRYPALLQALLRLRIGREKLDLMANA